MRSTNRQMKLYLVFSVNSVSWICLYLTEIFCFSGAHSKPQTAHWFFIWCIFNRRGQMAHRHFSQKWTHTHTHTHTDLTMTSHYQKFFYSCIALLQVDALDCTSLLSRTAQGCLHHCRGSSTFRTNTQHMIQASTQFTMYRLTMNHLDT